MIIGFNNKPLKIKKTGKIYPVDVELKNENGIDALYISTKAKFVECISDEYNLDEWKQAVLQGFCDWSGNYEVFGRQALEVRVSAVETDRLIDSIIVTTFDQEFSDELRDTYGRLKLDKAEKLVEEGRSFATAGFPVIGWKSYLPRFVYMLPDTLNNLDYARIVAKHEFGHVLGLGDLYKDLAHGLCGVEGATYKDIEKYYLGDSYFDMVMCNNSPVRNNDIEMVLLAFQTNSFQNYQKVKEKDKISEALGKGN